MLDRVQQRLHELLTSDRTERVQPTGSDRTLPAVNDHELARDLITDELRMAEATFWARWEEERDLGGAFEALTRWHGWRSALSGLTIPDSGDSLQFTVDSYVLRDCYQLLFAEPDLESIVYLTGPVTQSRERILARCVELDHQYQSVVRAEADPDASYEALRDFESNDHLLLCYCHNHPGHGRAGTRPSSDDRSLQQYYEENGYDTIGAIMTADGFVRFFSNNQPFTVEVYGNHVKQTESEPTVFRLDEQLRTAGPDDTDA